MAAGHGTSKAEVYSLQGGLVDNITGIKAGYIRTYWYGEDVSRARIYVGSLGCSNPLEFCLTGKTRFEDVNLLTCQWQKTQTSSKEGDWIDVPRGTIVALRDGNNCSMIRVNGFAPRWKSWDEAPKIFRCDGNAALMKANKIPPYNGWLFFDWQSQVVDSKQLAKATIAKVAKPIHRPKFEMKVANGNVTKNKNAQLFGAFRGARFFVGSVAGFYWGQVKTDQEI